jgi:hypothetical protein
MPTLPDASGCALQFLAVSLGQAMPDRAAVFKQQPIPELGGLAEGKRMPSSHVEQAQVQFRPEPSKQVRELFGTEFPLHKLPRSFLNSIKDYPQETPWGIGASTLLNLRQNKLIFRTHRLQDFGKEVYSITDAGRLALLIDDIAQTYDLTTKGKRERGPRFPSFRDLAGRLAKLREINNIASHGNRR